TKREGKAIRGIFEDSHVISNYALYYPSSLLLNGLKKQKRDVGGTTENTGGKISEAQLGFKEGRKNRLVKRDNLVIL
ncbi:hypothetical protein RYX36_010557, partial [Vicia faba]